MIRFYLVNIEVSISLLQGLSCIIHCSEDCCVGVGALQSFSLHLDGGQRSINLLQLLVVSTQGKQLRRRDLKRFRFSLSPLFPLKSLQR